jgi:CheY-like chemotaxis protein
MKFLLVDDNPSDILLTQRALDATGIPYEAHACSDGEEALRYLYNCVHSSSAPKTPDLILLDLNLPRKDGRAVLRAIKGDPELAAIPVIIMSTSQDPEDIESAYRLNANSYLIKPDDVDELFAAMQTLVAFWFQTAVLPSGRKSRVA